MTTPNTPSEDKLILKIIRPFLKSAWKQKQYDSVQVPSFGLLEQEATEAIQAHTNKQILDALDRVLSNDFFKFCTGCSCEARGIIITERSKL